MLSLTHKEKENYGPRTVKKYNFTGNHQRQPSQNAFLNPFQQDICNYSHDALPGHNLSRYSSGEGQFAGDHHSMVMADVKPGKLSESQSTHSMVSVEKYNQMLNMNLNLIKIIE